MSNDHWSHEEDGQAPEDDKKTKGILWMFRREPISETEFVQRFRRTPEEIRQTRWISAVVLASAAGVIIWMASWVLQGPGPFLPNQMFNRQQLMSYALSLGFGGILIGFKLCEVYHTLLDTFGNDQRTDLLIRYHDLLQQHNLLNQHPTTQHNSDEHTDQPT